MLDVEQGFKCLSNVRRDPTEKDENYFELEKSELRNHKRMRRLECCTQEIAIAKIRGEAISGSECGDCFEKPGTCWQRSQRRRWMFPVLDA